MDPILLGLLCGIAFGSLDSAIMLPMKFETSRKKKEAIAGAFLERFMVGLLIPNTNFGISPIITGIIIGFGLSLPTAIITRVYAPIIGIGILGGAVIGLISNSVL